MPEDYPFVHDPQRCLKCYSCEIACKQWREIAPGSFKLRKVYEVTTGTFPRVTRTFHSVACQHCADPPCVAVCAPGAIVKRAADGLVVVDPAKCNGCRECVEACPFGAPDFDDDGVMHLCDLCADRRLEGKRPLCTDVCPTGALRWNR